MNTVRFPPHVTEKRWIGYKHVLFKSLHLQPMVGRNIMKPVGVSSGGMKLVGVSSGGMNVTFFREKLSHTFNVLNQPKNSKCSAGAPEAVLCIGNHLKVRTM